MESSPWVFSILTELHAVLQQTANPDWWGSTGQSCCTLLARQGLEQESMKRKIQEIRRFGPKVTRKSPALPLLSVFLLLSLYNNKPIGIPSLGSTLRQIPVS